MFGVTIVCFAFLVHCSHGILRFPGTKWCGDNPDNEDLGFFRETDSCCRAHAHCDDSISPGETRFSPGQIEDGLKNYRKITRLHCKCEHAFYECLKNANEPIATIVGTGYFNVRVGGLGECFDEQHPYICVKYESIVGKEDQCIEYKQDTTQPKVWQWIYLPKFT